MKRIFIIHGWSGSSSANWMPWLKNELEKRGYEAFTPDMPDTDAPVIEKWVGHLSEIVGVPDSETYFVGHSIGCQAILRYLENVTPPVGGAVFVAGWFNLENMESEEEETIAAPWINNPINLLHVKSVLPRSTLVISDDDPYGAFEENRKRFAEVVTSEIVLHNGEHITDEAHPEILEEVLKL